MQLHTLSILVEDYAGVLTRVSSLFGRRGYNIHTLTVGTTEKPGYSRMTICVECTAPMVTQIVRQLEKLHCVQKVDVLTDGQSVSRELMLCKVATPNGRRSEVMEVANVFRANVVDVARNSLMLALTGSPDKNNALLDVLQVYGILEIARTGVAALSRNDTTIYQNMLDKEAL